MPGISDMKRDQCMIHYDTVWDRHHLFAIIPHIFPRSRSFLWLSCGWDDTTWVPVPAQIHWLMTSYSPLKNLAVLGGFATQKTIRHPESSRKKCLLTCFILFHQKTCSKNHHRSCLRMSQNIETRRMCESIPSVFFEKIDT